MQSELARNENSQSSLILRPRERVHAGAFREGCRSSGHEDLIELISFLSSYMTLDSKTVGGPKYARENIDNQNKEGKGPKDRARGIRDKYKTNPPPLRQIQNIFKNKELMPKYQ